MTLLVPPLLAGTAYGAAVVLDVAEPPRLGPRSHDGLVWWALNIASPRSPTWPRSSSWGWRSAGAVTCCPASSSSPAVAGRALVTGFVHGCFHLPLILIATTYDEFGSRWFVAPMVVGDPHLRWRVCSAYLWDRTGQRVAGCHGPRHHQLRVQLGAQPPWCGSQADLAYVAGESGIATFVVVAVAGRTVLLARAQGLAHGPAEPTTEEAAPWSRSPDHVRRSARSVLSCC